MSLENKFEVSPSVISTSTFKQQPRETLKDASAGINRYMMRILLLVRMRN
jgi:hypothetical protein